jgi:hypothetical protein
MRYASYRHVATKRTGRGAAGLVLLDPAHDGITERRPGVDWMQRYPRMRTPGAHCESTWSLGTITVISSLLTAELPKGGGSGLQCLISISDRGRRPKPHHVRKALRAFGLADGSERDNHHPGNAQHYWMPVDPDERVTCQCKSDEDTIRDADGYTWTNPKDADVDTCRGCEFAAVAGRPCPLHTVVAHG